MEDRRLIDVLTNQQLYECPATSRLEFEVVNNAYHLSEACAHIQAINRDKDDIGTHPDDVWTIALFLSEKLAAVLCKGSEG